MERAILEKGRLRDSIKKFLTVPGIGTILGLTIMLEVGDSGHFIKVGDCAFYRRCVESIMTSSGKKGDEGNGRAERGASAGHTRRRRTLLSAITHYLVLHEEGGAVGQRRSVLTTRH